MTEHDVDRAGIATLLVEQAPDAIIFADGEGIIRVWNAAAERIFGFAQGDALGKDLNIIIPEQFQDAHWKGYDRALGAGATKYDGKALPTRSVRADGETIYVELSFAVIKDKAGEVVGALAQARDITERREQERTLRARLRELEAGRDATG